MERRDAAFNTGHESHRRSSHAGRETKRGQMLLEIHADAAEKDAFAG